MCKSGKNDIIYHVLYTDVPQYHAVVFASSQLLLIVHCIIYHPIFYVFLIDMFRYNYTGTQFFDVNKNRPLARFINVHTYTYTFIHVHVCMHNVYALLIRLMELAKEIILESLPIKCLEAVVLALYLSAPVILLQRFPIGFKSIHNGKYHRYIYIVCL